jgi:hypothetical protein
MTISEPLRFRRGEREKSVMRSGLRGLLVAGVAAAGLTLASASGAAPKQPTVVRSAHAGIGGLVPPLTHAPTPSLGEIAGLCPFGCHGDDLDYHGGKVMRTNTTYAIYWLPSGFSFNSNDAGYENTINQFLTDVGHDSGTLGNVYATDTQYSDTTGSIAYNSAFVDSVVMTNPLPANGCSYTADDQGAPGHCLTDAQL